jgi:hypothetical protein
MNDMQIIEKKYHQKSKKNFKNWEFQKLNKNIFLELEVSMIHSMYITKSKINELPKE